MTTEAAAARPTEVDEARAALAATLAELEGRPVAQFRTMRGPVGDVARRAVELDAQDLVQRARLLQIGAMLREGSPAAAGQAAHQVLAWAQQHDSAYLMARAHRELAVFYRQVGDLSTALTHAVQCVAHLTDDVPVTIRARHLLSLAVALDENGSAAEADRRFREALHIATTLEDTELTMYLLNNMAYTAYEKGDELAARELIDHLRAVQREGGHVFSANELDTIARVELMDRRYASVEATLGATLDDGPGGPPDHEGDALAECRLTLAEARRRDGRYRPAQRALDAARRLADARGLRSVGARIRAEQAALFAAAGRFQLAYEEHCRYHAEVTALQSAQRDARARALQAVYEATEARRASDEYRELAHRDALTGLHNRRYVNEWLPALLGEAAVRQIPVSLALLDLDHFKRVNDTLSHGAGDAVLQQFAQLLAEAATGSCVAARMGGEEFLLIMPGVPAAAAAERCERLRQRIRGHAWQPITGSLPVTSSIGLTTVDNGRITASALLSQADHNLYAAKRAGRDRVVTDTPRSAGASDTASWSARG